MTPGEPICHFSPCELYRYTLWRDANPDADGVVAFIGLNPSTATATLDDPTIRRCIRFTRDWGYRWYCMLNVFAFRATDPKVMKAQSDPFGPDNYRHIGEIAYHADVLVAAWGVHGPWMDGDAKLTEMLKRGGRKLKCLGKTKDGHPKHPLYVKADTQLIDYP